MSNYVIYDCDCGTDDAWGLLMLIKGEAHKQSGPDGNGYKILAVTTNFGNSTVEHVTRNTLRVLDCAERTDIPLYKGCGKSIIPGGWNNDELFHGKDGFGDVKHDKEVDMSLVQPKHAVNAMYDYVCEYPNKVDFILVGPLTNFATCITMYGEAFLSKVRNVYVMGGNYRGKGNVTKSAEYNFMCDPEAAHIVLANVQTPVSIVPWETCIDGEFGLTWDWRLNVVGKVPNKAVQLLNKVEGSILKRKGFVKWLVCDAILVAAYIFPKIAIIKSRGYHVTVELTGTHTRGQMVLDHLNFFQKTKADNVNIIMEVNGDYFRKAIAWTAGVEGTTID